MERGREYFAPNSAQESNAERKSRAQRGVEFLGQQAAEVPAVRAYLNLVDITNAVDIFQQIPQILADNPHLLARLIQAHAERSNTITILVIPQFPLVLAHTAEGISALAPVLGCTYQAIRDLNIPKKSSAVYHSSFSENLVSRAIWNRLEKDSSQILTYVGSELKPEDYISIGAAGFLSNEVLRMGIPFPSDI